MTIRSQILILGVVFCVTLAWSTLLFQGLPVGDTDDWDKIQMADEVSWSEFATTFFTPWSRSAYWVGQTDRNDEVRYKRSLLPMFLKALGAAQDGRSFCIYFVTKGISFAGTVTLLTALLIQTVPLGLALLGSVIFILVPAHYSHVLWIADSATMAYFFLFLGIFLLVFVDKNIRQRGSTKEFAWLLLALFLTAWTGIRAKELVLLLPLVVFFYSLCSFRAWQQTPVRLICLNLLMVLVAFQIIPILHLSHQATPLSGFKGDSLVRLLLRNYETGYDNESQSAFLSWKSVFPVSVARTLGFFLLWACVYLIVLFGLRKWRWKNKTLPIFWDNSVVQIAGIWLLLEIPFLGMFQPDPRYFSGTLAPILILILRLFYCSLKGLRKSVLIPSILIVLFGVGFNIEENIQHVFWLRLMIGKKMHYFMETGRAILGDIRGKSLLSDSEVGTFYKELRPESVPGDSMGRHTYYTDLDVQTWNRVPIGQDNLDDFGKWAEKGYPYYVTFKDYDLSSYPSVRLLHSIQGMNKSSLFEKLNYAIHQKKRPGTLHIYKRRSMINLSNTQNPPRGE